MSSSVYHIHLCWTCVWVFIINGIINFPTSMQECPFLSLPWCLIEEVKRSPSSPGFLCCAEWVCVFQGNCPKVSSINDRNDWKMVRKALSVIGFTDDEVEVWPTNHNTQTLWTISQCSSRRNKVLPLYLNLSSQSHPSLSPQELLNIIASVLHLGNVQYGGEDSGSAYITTETQIKYLARVIGQFIYITGLWPHVHDHLFMLKPLAIFFMSGGCFWLCLCVYLWYCSC